MLQWTLWYWFSGFHIRIPLLLSFFLYLLIIDIWLTSRFSFHLTFSFLNIICLSMFVFIGEYMCVYVYECVCLRYLFYFTFLHFLYSLLDLFHHVLNLLASDQIKIFFLLSFCFSKFQTDVFCTIWPIYLLLLYSIFCFCYVLG